MNCLSIDRIFGKPVMSLSESLPGFLRTMLIQANAAAFREAYKAPKTAFKPVVALN